MQARKCEGLTEWVLTLVLPPKTNKYSNIQILSFKGPSESPL